MKKNMSWLVAMAILAIVVISMISLETHKNQKPPMSPILPIDKSNSSADWVSNATTIPQLMKEADLVVRARAIKGPQTRIVQSEQPIVNEDGTEIIGIKLDEMAFSDTVFEILQVYFGKASENITIMQTGGIDFANPEVRSEMNDDPLYEIGEEYVLFLVDISGDPIQAPDRELFRIVNPYGRYRVEPNGITCLGEDKSVADLPISLEELEIQIKNYQE